MWSHYSGLTGRRELGGSELALRAQRARASSSALQTQKPDHTRGWESSMVGKEVAVLAGGASVISRPTSHWESQDSSVGTLKSGGSWGTAAHQRSTLEVQTREKPYFKSKVHGSWLELNLWCPHTCVPAWSCVLTQNKPLDMDLSFLRLCSAVIPRAK